MHPPSLQPTPQRHGHPHWLITLLVILAVLVLLWPTWQGRELRRLAAQHRLDMGWRPDYRLLPRLGLAHHQSVATGGELSRQQRDQLWREMEAFRGSYPVFFWLELAWLEARAGDDARARQALQRARDDNPRLFKDMTRARLWDPWRERYGLPQR
ncbi:hypothetical protein [Desulfoferula mesophila]|uniref:Uncharacterized protein n=1 Tax=Desulfoferula mesophila TaxID=3058419 RepID=A0AAU9EB74_9BACT|nr:hypothetical protein FAK_14140 [Desulfoferula mesophilus]